MNFKIDGPGVALSSLLLSVNMLILLERKGLLSTFETRELVDLALLNLEQHEHLAPPATRETVRSARFVLESIRDGGDFV